MKTAWDMLVHHKAQMGGLEDFVFLARRKIILSRKLVRNPLVTAAKVGGICLTRMSHATLSTPQRMMIATIQRVRMLSVDFLNIHWNYVILMHWYDTSSISI